LCIPFCNETCSLPLCLRVSARVASRRTNRSPAAPNGEPRRDTHKSPARGGRSSTPARRGGAGRAARALSARSTRCAASIEISRRSSKCGRSRSLRVCDPRPAVAAPVPLHCAYLADARPVLEPGAPSGLATAGLSLGDAGGVDIARRRRGFNKVYRRIASLQLKSADNLVTYC